MSRALTFACAFLVFAAPEVVLACPDCATSLEVRSQIAAGDWALYSALTVLPIALLVALGELGPRAWDRRRSR